MSEFYTQFLMAHMAGFIVMLILSLYSFTTKCEAERKWRWLSVWAMAGLLLAVALDYSRVLDVPGPASFRTEALVMAGWAFNAVAVYAALLTGKKWQREQDKR